jgi:hypothetical protein
VVAAAFLAGSPLFAIQSATYLSYLFNAALLMGFAAALLAGVRRRSRPSLALAGLLLGLAVFARPFDAVLVAGPLLAWWGWTERHRARRLVGEAVWMGLGAVPPLVAMAVYFRAATGSFLRPPFTFVGPGDTLGFGPKRMYAGMPFLDYTPGRALVAVGRLTVLTGFWGFGGLVLIGLAVIGYRSLRGGAGRWLALVAVTVPLGYAFFWGSFSSSEWGGPWRFGPFYWLPVIIPGCILAAAGFARLWRWDRLAARLVAGGMAAVSLFVIVQALAEHRRYGAERDQLYAAPLAAATLDRAVVFLPPLDGPWLLQPFSLARNATLDAPVVWAVDRGPRQNLDVIRHFPGRAPYRVVMPVATSRFGTTLERLTVVGGRLVPASGLGAPGPGEARRSDRHPGEEEGKRSDGHFSDAGRPGERQGTAGRRGGQGHHAAGAARPVDGGIRRGNQRFPE